MENNQGNVENNTTSWDSATKYDNRSSMTNLTASGKDSSEILRPFALNMFTVAFHVIAFMFIIFPKGVKPSLRIFLVSLSMPGLIQNLAWGTVRGCELWVRGPLTDSEPGCFCLLFITELGILCGQTTVAMLTINNFLAVTYPIIFKQWVTTTKTFACIISMWIFWALVITVVLVSKPDMKKPCLPLLVTPVYMLMIQAMVILLTSLIMAILNFKLVQQFTGKFRVQPLNQPQAQDVVNDDLGSEYLNYPSMYAGGPSTVFSVARDSVSITDDSLSNPQNKTKQSFSRQKHHFRRNNKISHVPESNELQIPRARHGHKENNIKASTPTSVSPPARARPVNIRTTRKLRIRNMAITLIVLSAWNSVGYLPYMVCFLLAVHSRDQGLPKDVITLTDIAGHIIRTSLIGNTFIYAWRFIKWQAVFNALQRRAAKCC